MDQQEQLAWDSKTSVAVLGKGSEFVLIPLDGTPAPASRQLAEVRGYHYCGILGYRNRKVEAVCEPNPNAALTMLHASLKFAEAVCATAAPAAEDWMERLYQLPDTRDN
jgi:hypothetical protein